MLLATWMSAKVISLADDYIMYNILNEPLIFLLDKCPIFSDSILSSVWGCYMFLFCIM